MARKKKDKHESDALGDGELELERADAEAIGDPAAASVEAEGAVPGTAEVEAPGAGTTAYDPVTEPLAGDPAAESGEGTGGWEPPGEQTPAAADARGAEHAEGPPV